MVHRRRRVGHLGCGIGIALKIADGGTRASEAAITALLVRLGLLDAGHPVVGKYLTDPLRNWRGIAVAERRLTRGDALPLIAAMRTGHFAPGSAYSYCNANFRLLAEMIEAEAPDTVRFTRQIKDRIALEDRRAVLAALWEVAYADNSRGADEDSLIRLVSSLLGMTDRESAEIRQHVLARIGLEP